MKNFAIYANSTRDHNYLQLHRIAGFLSSILPYGTVSLIGDEDAVAAHKNMHGTGLNILSGDTPLHKTNCIITLGGDGTLLRAAAVFAVPNGVPLMGINLGNIGYLTDVGIDNAESALKDLLSGNFMTEERLMLEAGSGSANHTALNDALITRHGNPGIMQFIVKVNGVFMDRYRADGIIVSTPTGSTAYNLSAGGPVLSPGLKALAITPICAHALHVRSAIVSSSDIIEITVQSSNIQASLYTDGRFAEIVPPSSPVTITQSPTPAKIIKTKDSGKNFYDILRGKLCCSP
ncbi:MAG: NAD(+)/NADH kinase [Defluviitaleaceae bacterium]|nr:NAD(+)/NADH kinase [Defluviitaleaceae bacterium]